MSAYFDRLWSKIAANFDWPNVAESCELINQNQDGRDPVTTPEEVVELAYRLCWSAFKTGAVQASKGLVASYSFGRLRLHFEVDRVTAMDINGEIPNQAEL